MSAEGVVSGVGLGAAEILAQHWMDEDQDCVKCRLHFVKIVEHAQHQLDALKAAGYTVVCPSSALRMFVAEAICAATSAGRVFPWASLNERDREQWGLMADAALSALMEADR